MISDERDRKEERKSAAIGMRGMSRFECVGDKKTCSKPLHTGKNHARIRPFRHSPRFNNNHYIRSTIIHPPSSTTTSNNTVSIKPPWKLVVEDMHVTSSKDPGPAREDPTGTLITH